MRACSWSQFQLTSYQLIMPDFTVFSLVIKSIDCNQNLYNFFGYSIPTHLQYIILMILWKINGYNGANAVYRSTLVFIYGNWQQQHYVHEFTCRRKKKIGCDSQRKWKAIIASKRAHKLTVRWAIFGETFYLVCD